MSVHVCPVPHLTTDKMNLELFCTVCDSYFGWYDDTPVGVQDARRHALAHEESCQHKEDAMSSDHTEPAEQSHSCGCQGRFKCQYHIGNADGYEDGKRDATQSIIEWLIEHKDEHGKASFVCIQQATAIARGHHEKGSKQ